VGRGNVRPTFVIARADDGRTPPRPVPDPGAISEIRTAVICAPGYADAHRVWHNKAATIAKYGLPLSAADRHENDDLIPGAEAKDALEHRILYRDLPFARRMQRLPAILGHPRQGLDGALSRSDGPAAMMSRYTGLPMTLGNARRGARAADRVVPGLRAPG
jgi:hypothetical protein